MNHVLHVPKITKNLLSVSQFTKDNNIIAEFYSNCCLIKEKITRRVLLQGKLSDGLYRMVMAHNNSSTSLPSAYFADFKSNNQPCAVESVTKSKSPTMSQSLSPFQNNQSKKFSIWHRRLGHPCVPILKNVMNTIGISNNFEFDFCTACQLGKSHKISFQNSTNVSSYPIELIHSGIWGSTSISSKEGYKYYVNSIDDYSKYTWIYPLHLKLEAKTIFQKFQILVERHFDRKVKIPQTD